MCRRVCTVLQRRTHKARRLRDTLPTLPSPLYGISLTQKARSGSLPVTIMSSSSSIPDLPIDAHHVCQQFTRRGSLAPAEFLYGEVATRMMERLRYIRIEPGVVLDAGCGDGARMAKLSARFPEAEYVGLDFCAPFLAQAQARVPTGLGDRWRRWRGQSPRTRFVQADLAQTGIDPESLGMVWSNLALHWHPQPHRVLAEWQRILKVGGLAMFSCFGPATFQELRLAVATAGLNTTTPAFVDMHDLGDLLVESGFGDPVMDQETLVLTYADPATLLADVRALGGNPAIGRRAGLLGRDKLAQLHQALDAQRGPDGRLSLSLEITYGHAWRGAARRVSATETRLSVEAIGRGRASGER